MTYAGSSHRRRWIYSAQGLKEERCRVRASARVAAEVARAEQALLPVTTPPSTNKDPHPTLSDEDEALLLRQTTRQLLSLANKIGIPRKVIFIALIFFHRFFVAHSVLDYVPHHLLAACLMTATKAENNEMFSTRSEPFSATRFLSALKDAAGGRNMISASELVRLETALLEGLDFSLMVYTPAHAVKGAIKHLVSVGCVTKTIAVDLQAAALSVAEDMMLSDAPLLVHPGEMAWACLERAATSFGVAEEVHAYLPQLVDVARRLRDENKEVLVGVARSAHAFLPIIGNGSEGEDISRGGDAGATTTLDAMGGSRREGTMDGDGDLLIGVRHAHACLDTLQAALAADADRDMGAVMKACKATRNPAFDPGSRLYQARRRAEKAAKSEKEAEKQRAWKRKAEEDRRALLGDSPVATKRPRNSS